MTTSQHTTAPPLDHAIVLGASIAGLCAARVLADRARRVTLVERDVLPPGDVSRRGVPQGLHAHGLLSAGLECFEQLFPGIVEALEADGAQVGDPAEHGLWINDGLGAARGASDLRGVIVTRPLLESHVRRHVLSLANVALVEDHTADTLLGTARAVTGVRVRPRRGDGEPVLLHGDLVVDATGRGSKMPARLKALGAAAPDEDRVEVGLGYTTRLFPRVPGEFDDVHIINVAPSPPGRRGGVAMAVEGDRWMVTLAGLLGEHAPTDIEGFADFAAGLPSRELHALVAGREPLGDAVRTRFPAHRRRRYERLATPPEGFVAIGDAICSFNPIYGQGMTVAALEAIELGRCLDEGGCLPRRFHAAAARLINVAWAVAVGNDLRFPEVIGPRSARTRFVNRYVARLHVAAHHDPLVARAFQRVANFAAPLPSVLAPRVAWRVIVKGRRPVGASVHRPRAGTFGHERCRG